MQDSGLTHLMANAAVAERHYAVQHQAPPAAAAAPPADDDDDDDEEVLAQWVGTRGSLRVDGLRFCRRVERNQADAGDIEILAAIMAAPAADWSAELAVMAGRAGPEAAEALRRVAAVMARAASGPAPMEF
ncbi:hypothetical protein HDU90_006255 [Geranomyces variabilis]|nr:hypothetical protein HDU90_006255 [Geranomyces variabilis]